ncbi:MAG TPA: cytochrome c biogenesis protein CcdA [Spirochaetota bacterium]|nr:cytochrome c biogenesis protein CcdA [Spirochaetota bacterium]HOL57021.1 cytochrome c biogenesis protein CcdA [Spirochaetota bacterium]HPP04600.1 cytochrome c biogenesis protein CcdA [Spirochaetota bacterium]
MENLFIFLTELLYKNWVFGLVSAFVWGILSVILSPCHIASIPLIMAFIGRQGKIKLYKAFLISLVFSLGILISITFIGFITAITGRVIGNIGLIGYIIVFVIFIIVGLNFLGVINIPDIIKFNQPKESKGLLGGFLLGLMFGLALGPCTFAFMAPILSIVFTNATKNFILSFFLITFYAIGHCLVFIIFGTFSELAQKFLNWDEKSNATIVVKKIIGVIIIIAGIYILIFNILRIKF